MTTKRNEIWLTFNGEAEKLLFPVNPEQISVTRDGKIDSIDITELGEIIIKQGRPAVEISWQSFFPLTPFPGVSAESISNPYETANKIIHWKERSGVCHLIVTYTSINYYVLINNFRMWEEGGDIGTVYYDISLKEYREISVRQVNVDVNQKKATVEQTEQRVDSREQPKTYTVKSGDCLWNIAKKLYGSGSKYNKIYDANKSVIGGNPNLIYAGQVLTIPE